MSLVKSLPAWACGGGLPGYSGPVRRPSDANTHIHRDGAEWRIKTELHNVSKTPALMVRVKAVRSKSGDLIVPALYDDNYVALMPGEKQTISISLEDADTRGEKPSVRVSGYNFAKGR